MESRWPSLLQPDARQLQLFPIPPQPTSAAEQLRARLGPEPSGQQTSAEVLQQLINLLQPVDVGSLHLLRPGPEAVPAVSQLHQELMALAPGIFDANEQSLPSPPQLIDPHSQPASASPAYVDNGRAGPVLPPAPAMAATEAPSSVPKPPKLRHGVSKAVVIGQGALAPQQLAELYASYVTQLLDVHERLLTSSKADINDVAEESEEDEECEEIDDLSSLKAAAQKQQALLGDMRRLAEETLQLSQAGGALRLIEADLLMQLLCLLQAIIRPGCRFISEDEQDASARMQNILVAMEAATAALRVLATPNLPQQVYNEDLLESVVNLTKFHLAHNVYAFHDARFAGTNRPPLGEDEEPQGKEKSAKKGKKALGGVRVPRAAKLLQDRCQSVLGLLGELLGVVPLHTGVLVPLARVAMQALTVEGIPLLQGKAVGLLVSAFQHYPASRQAFLDDFFSHVINYFVAGKRAMRDFVCSEDSSTSIQMLTAAVLQMVQASVALPAMDTNVKQLPKCYAHAVHWSDYFWSLCFDRLPAARAQKSDTEQDFKLLLEQLLQDLLEVACLPEWPAATVLLLRFVTVLSGPKGLQHADVYVRQTCVDFLGMVSARLHQFQLATVAGESWLQELAGQRGYEDPLEAASALLLSYLADKARGPMACSARQFLVCRAFAEEATSLQRREAGPQELQLLLASYRKQQDDMSMLPAESAPSPAEARRLTQALVRKTLGNARQSSILWLLDAVEPRQPPTVRAKAVKALGVAVEADPGILEQPEVQKAVEKALQDDSVSVREAALELLGRHIAGNNQGLALRLFPILAKACSDTGTSVKKRAIKLLWECCISAPGFPAATEACKHVLIRAGDNEESVQDMVSKVFHSLWFTPRLEAGGAGVAVERSAAQRAQQLADVALAVYEAGGRGIHLPLDLNHPLVVALRAALGFHTKGDLKKEWAAGREITQALLTAYLQAEEVALAEAGPPANGAAPAQQQPGAFPGFRYMLSLHAFAVTDVELCMPASDPARCVKTLAPYLKPSADARQQSQDDQRRGAEELLCILSVLDDVLGQLPTLDSIDLRDIVLDLVTLINKNPFTVVVGTACKCLCTVASKDPQAAPKLAELVAVYANLLQRDSVQNVFVSRYLFTLGHLCRYGADVIERTKPESGKELITMQGCLALFAGFFQRCGPSPDQQRVQEAALQAIGMLTIARPGIMTQSKAAAKILQSALAPGAPHAFKRTALSNLNEMLRSDEQLLMARQQAADDGSAKGKGRGKQQQNKQGGAGSAVQTQNGQGDSLSLSSGILQYHWEMVLRLATDTSTGAATPSTPSTSASLGVRRQALALIETVLRGGLVAPWTAVAPLVALTTDPTEELRVRALKLLKQEAEKRADFLENKLPAGVVEAYEFHARLVQTGALRPPRGVLPPEVASGLQLLYKELVQPNKALRTSFLQNLLKRFDLACTPASHASGPAASSLGNGSFSPSDLELLRFCAAVAASLPYKRGDEPCSVVYQVNGIVARRGAGLLEDFKAALQSQEQGGNEAALAHCRASVALSMLLVLKDYLKKAYSLSTERVASFGPSGERRKQEERTPVSQLDSVPCHLDKLDLEATASPEGTLQQYKVFKKLMSQDTADYDHLSHAAAPGSRRGGSAKVAEGVAAGSPNGAAADEEAGTPDWVLGNGAGGGPATKLARWGSRKTGTGGSKQTKSRATINTVKATSKKKKRKKSGSEDDSEDEDYTPKAAATKKKLHL